MRSRSLTAKQRLQAVQQKFSPQPNPLEREQELNILQPTDAEQQQKVTKMLALMKQGADAPTQHAIAMIQMQLASGAINDQVKMQFVRDFYFWLQGRGTDADTKKTMWGRGNAAVHNPEVAAYIQAFAQKRLQYAQQLLLLANRVPSTLNGYYLYYKYITRGKLRHIQDESGGFWDLSNDDFLDDFELFQQYFDDPRRDYKPIIKPATTAAAAHPGSLAPPTGAAPSTASDPYPRTTAERKQWSVDRQPPPREPEELRLAQQYRLSVAGVNPTSDVQQKNADNAPLPGERAGATAGNTGVNVGSTSTAQTLGRRPGTTGLTPPSSPTPMPRQTWFDNGMVFTTPSGPPPPPAGGGETTKTADSVPPKEKQEAEVPEDLANAETDVDEEDTEEDPPEMKRKIDEQIKLRAEEAELTDRLVAEANARLRRLEEEAAARLEQARKEDEAAGKNATEQAALWRLRSVPLRNDLMERRADEQKITQEQLNAAISDLRGRGPQSEDTPAVLEPQIAEKEARLQKLDTKLDKKVTILRKDERESAEALRRLDQLTRLKEDAHVQLSQAEAEFRPGWKKAIQALEAEDAALLARSHDLSERMRQTTEAVAALSREINDEGTKLEQLKGRLKSSTVKTRVSKYPTSAKSKMRERAGEVDEQGSEQRKAAKTAGGGAEKIPPKAMRRTKMKHTKVWRAQLRVPDIPVEPPVVQKPQARVETKRRERETEAPTTPQTKKAKEAQEPLELSPTLPKKRLVLRAPEVPPPIPNELKRPVSQPTATKLLVRAPAVPSSPPGLHNRPRTPPVVQESPRETNLPDPQVAAVYAAVPRILANDPFQRQRTPSPEPIDQTKRPASPAAPDTPRKTKAPKHAQEEPQPQADEQTTPPARHLVLLAPVVPDAPHSDTRAEAAAPAAHAEADAPNIEEPRKPAMVSYPDADADAESQAPVVDAEAPAPNKRGNEASPEAVRNRSKQSRVFQEDNESPYRELNPEGIPQERAANWFEREGMPTISVGPPRAVEDTRRTAASQGTEKRKRDLIAANTPTGWDTDYDAPEGVFQEATAQEAATFGRVRRWLAEQLTSPNPEHVQAVRDSLSRDYEFYDPKTTRIFRWDNLTDAQVGQTLLLLLSGDLLMRKRGASDTPQRGIKKHA